MDSIGDFVEKVPRLGLLQTIEWKGERGKLTPMNVRQIEANVEALMGSWSKDTFIYELLLAYGLPKATVTRAMKGTANMSKERGVVQLKSKVLFKPVQGQDLHVSVEHAAKQATHKERFVIVTDFKTLLAKDMSGKATPLETPFDELHKHYAYFLPWAGLEKTAVVNENPADRKAAEKLARLYDDLKKANNVESDEQRHALNVFLTRLLFCFFAEDTGIFEDGQFSVGLGSHTADDGSDSSDYLRRLFNIMGTPEDKRESLPQHLAAFPFVGESLFGDDLPVPDITRRGRSTILAAGDLDWAAINPDIFGSMIQAVVSEENRGELGMHYTSVPNIMKVIGPLFLDELHEEFDKAQGSETRLRKLLHRIHNLHIFDPACGSGNFLIITYKELRRLEMKILKQFNELPISGIRLDHFHGIEIDGFAQETAKLSMWLAEHQMNREFEEVMGRSLPSLPLGLSSNVVQGNSCRIEWTSFIDEKADEVFLIGNPPYVGAHLQTPSQKEDLKLVFAGYRAVRKLDYISCWVFLAARFMSLRGGAAAVVSTNSICQGEQVGLLWPIVEDLECEISFAHRSFLWSNNAKGKASVFCIIVGITSQNSGVKKLYDNGAVRAVKNISPYLLDAPTVYVHSRSSSLSGLPQMIRGSSPVDGGHLILTESEKQDLISAYPDSKKFIKRLVGAEDFLNGKVRYALWIDDDCVEEAKENPIIKDRLSRVRQFRLSSSKVATQKASQTSHAFFERKHRSGQSIIVPRVTSVRRRYLQCGFLDDSSIVLDRAQVVYDGSPFLLAILSSTMHLVWVAAVSGRLKMDYNYSVSICYNNFVLPALSQAKIQELSMCALRILEVRERYPDRTLAELYDPDKMPEDLLEAHKLNDEAVERCYRARPFESDEDRLQVLFDLYAKMTAEEADKGSLFESSKTKKKRKRHA